VVQAHGVASPDESQPGAEHDSRYAKAIGDRQTTSGETHVHRPRREREPAVETFDERGLACAVGTDDGYADPTPRPRQSNAVGQRPDPQCAEPRSPGRTDELGDVVPVATGGESDDDGAGQAASFGNRSQLHRWICRQRGERGESRLVPFRDPTLVEHAVEQDHPEQDVVARSRQRVALESRQHSASGDARTAELNLRLDMEPQELVGVRVIIAHVHLVAAHRERNESRIDQASLRPISSGGRDEKVDVAGWLRERSHRAQQAPLHPSSVECAEGVVEPRRPPRRLMARVDWVRHRATLPPFPAKSPLPPAPKLSIVITNYNYERFLDEALDSALGQRGVDIEVIVVDDCSSDGSRQIITRRGDRVTPVFLPENRGQKAAFNAGLVASTGDIVLFLDADDRLDPDIAANVVDAFLRVPGAARVVFRLAVIDADGRATGAVVPDARVPLPQGDVRELMLRFPDDLAWPPTSGNAFAAWALKRILPLPVDRERAMADHDLHTLVPMLGVVVALDGVGGAYRVQGENAHARAGLDLERSRTILRLTAQSHARLDEAAREQGIGDVRLRSVTVAGHRIVSLRLDPSHHPTLPDSRWRAMASGTRAAIGRFDVSVGRRVAYVAWFVAAGLLPRRYVTVLAERAFQSTGLVPPRKRSR
jgi:hypothetical protein